MAPRAVALLSGGLDSTLATRIVMEQGVEVEAVNFRTMFACCKDDAARVARELGVRLTVVEAGDDYVELIREPKYGYGKGANPCIDCRIYMFQIAARFMEDVGAEFVISGEVLGQRPKSQKRRDLMTISAQSGLRDRLLRPLSARLLPRTLPEREGWVDRRKFFSFVGRNRKPLIELAKQYGMRDIPSPSTGCSLTETSFAGKVHDLVRVDPDSQRWDFELLNLGRHIRLDRQTKVVVGRREEENLALEHMYERPENRASLLLAPRGFKGPTALVVGPANETTLRRAGGLVLRYSKHFDPQGATVRLREGDREREVRVCEEPEVEELATL